VRQRKIWVWAAVAACTLGIGVATLHSTGGRLARGWSFYITTGEAALAELIANLILFIPLGISLALAGVKPLRAIAAGTLLSCTVEFLQQWIPGRDPSLGDIVANANSTAIGVLLVVAAPIWLLGPPRRSRWQALGCAILAVLVWIATADLLRPTFPPLPYQALLNPDIPHFSHYDGKIIDVRPGIARMDITATMAPDPPEHTAPMIAVEGQHGERVLMLSVNHNDLTLRYYMPALRLSFEQPDLRLRDALKPVAPGDTFVASTWHDSTDVCLRLNSKQQCDLGYTIGDGWKLIYYPENWPPWQLGLINTLWVAGLVTGVGFWGVRGDSALIRRVAIAIAILGSLIVPMATELNATTVNEFIGVIAGIVLGRALARR
jgi:VanZ family protein